jgi:hypothetical protein
VAHVCGQSEERIFKTKRLCFIGFEPGRQILLLKLFDKVDAVSAVDMRALGWTVTRANLVCLFVMSENMFEQTLVRKFLSCCGVTGTSGCSPISQTGLVCSWVVRTCCRSSTL